MAPPGDQTLPGKPELALLVGFRWVPSLVVAAKQEHDLVPLDAEEDSKEHRAGIGIGQLALALKLEAVEHLIHGVVEPKLEEPTFFL